jgi:hypothetical protein
MSEQTSREELADLIYRTLQGEQWLPTADGTGNVASHILADAILAAGWRPHRHDGAHIHDLCSICHTTFWQPLMEEAKNE